jgi:hypothetical protein
MTQPNIWPPVEAMVVLRKSDREELLVIERPRHSNGQMLVVQRGGTWNYEWSRVSLDELMPDDRKERIDRGVDSRRFMFTFQTANGVPRPIFAKLAAMYPLARFDVESIDEGGWEYEATYEGGVETRFAEVPESNDRYLRVYGRKCPVYDDDDDDDDDGEEIEQAAVSP